MSIRTAVATDDIALISNVSAQRVDYWGQRVDGAFAASGVEQNAGKTVNGTKDGTIIGIDLYRGFFLGCHAPRAAAYLLAVTEVLQQGRASPAQVERALGQPHWVWQLSRRLF